MECSARRAVRSLAAFWCAPRAFEHSNRYGTAYVLSDAPGLLESLKHTNPHLIVSERTASMSPAAARHEANASLGTRSWSNGFDAKLMAAIDAISAGLATEVHFSRYSSMLKPAVARSMCTRTLTTFHDAARSACPQLDKVFVRNLGPLTQYAGKYMCARKQLPPGHPCLSLSPGDCRMSFVRAMA